MHIALIFLRINFLPYMQVKDIVLGGIPVRLYTPIGDKKDRKGIVHIHGGGWTVLSISKVLQLIIVYSLLFYWYNN